MQRSTSRKAALSTAALIGFIGALFVVPVTSAHAGAPGGAAPSAAAHGGDRDGDADRDPGTAFTEDDDTNDGGTRNNVADAGDDRHPSGNDRSVEAGKSGNQGRAESDPDDNGRRPERTNGGRDKPNGAGGVDKADQDGDNGCGNDDDFEDDNEGRCRRPTTAKPARQQTAAKSDTATKSGTAGKSGSSAGGQKSSSSLKAQSVKTQSGNGTATITVDAGCRTVTVTSSKDISSVVVRFADGTSVKFEGLSGRTWSRTFDKLVASATAKSATTQVTDASGCVSSSTVTQCPAGMVDTNGDAAGGCALPGTSGVPCPAGTVDMNGSAAGGCVTPDGEELATGGTVGRGAKGPAGQGPAGDIATSGPARAETVRATSAGGAALATFAAGSGAGALAVTGVALALPAAIGAMLLVLGYLLVFGARRRSQL